MTYKGMSGETRANMIISTYCELNRIIWYFDCGAVEKLLICKLAFRSLLEAIVWLPDKLMADRSL